MSSKNDEDSLTICQNAVVLAPRGYVPLFFIPHPSALIPKFSANPAQPPTKTEFEQNIKFLLTLTAFLRTFVQLIGQHFA